MPGRIALALTTFVQLSTGGPLIADARALEELIRPFDGVVGVYARDLDTRAEIAINADARFPTASVIKVAVMLEAYERAARGTIGLDATLTLREQDKVGGSGVLKGMSAGLALPVRDLVHLMITLSDNTATNLLVNRLGVKNINERLVAHGLTSTKLFRQTFRDGKPEVHPELEREFGLGMATPREMATLLALVADGRAVDADASRRMAATLEAQQDRAMIPRLLPANVTVGNKTGTDSEKLADERGRRGAIRTDAAIVTGEGVRYVIAVFVRRGGDTASGPDNAGVLLGAKISRVVHDHFAAARRGR